MAIDLDLGPAPRTGIGRRLDGWSEDRVIAVGMYVAIAAALGQLVTQAIDFGFFDLRIGVLDSDTHASIFGVASLLAMAAAALAAGARAATSAQRGRWLALSAVLLVLLVIRAGLPDDPWALAAPLAVLFAMYWHFTADDPPRIRNLVRLSLVLLAFSFVVHLVGMRIVTGLGYSYNSWPYEVKAILKHTGELAGWILIAAGVLAGSLSERTSAATRW